MLGSRVSKKYIFKPLRGMRAQSFVQVVEHLTAHLAKVDSSQASTLCYKEIALYLAWQGVKDTSMVQTLRAEDTDGLVTKPLLRATVSRILTMENAKCQLRVNRTKTLMEQNSQQQTLQIAALINQAKDSVSEAEAVAAVNSCGVDATSQNAALKSNDAELDKFGIDMKMKPRICSSLSTQLMQRRNCSRHWQHEHAGRSSSQYKVA